MSSSVPMRLGMPLKYQIWADRGGQFDVAHALAANLRARHFNAALVADNALVAHALVFAAVALPVLGSGQDALAVQTVALRLEGAVVNRFRLADLAVGPRAGSAPGKPWKFEWKTGLSVPTKGYTPFSTSIRPPPRPKRGGALLRSCPGKDNYLSSRSSREISSKLGTSSKSNTSSSVSKSSPPSSPSVSSASVSASSSPVGSAARSLSLSSFWLRS